jgi:PAS domain S-box-containing protein
MAFAVAVAIVATIAALAILIGRLRRVASELAAARAELRDARARIERSEVRAEELRELGTAVVRSSADAIVSTDLGGVVTTWNRGAEAILGYSAEEIVGRHGDVLWIDAALARELLGSARRGEDVVSREVVARRKDGETVLISLTVSPLRDAGGEIIGLSSVAQDITERKRLEAGRRQRQKLEALGTLAGGIAHDFNNLLWVILGNAQLAQRAVGPGSPAAGQLDRIVDASRRASELVDRILSFARPSAVAPRPVHLGRIVEEGAALLRTTAPPGVRISTDLREPEPWVEAEPSQLSQIVMNLGANAIAALSGSGSLLFRVSEWGADVGSDGAGSSAILLEVSDTGSGIAPEHLDTIFDPFFTTREVGRGSGLGLAIVQGIVSSLGGEIDLLTAVGRGSTFRVRLPRGRASYETDGAPLPATPPASPVGHGEEILVVDDDLQVVALLESLLVDAGYTVRALADPIAAADAFAAEPDRFRLAVVDQVMPNLNGSDLLARMRTVRPELRALLLSGYHDPLGEKPSPDGVLRKPIESRELIDRVSALLDEARSAPVAAVASARS